MGKWQMNQQIFIKITNVQNWNSFELNYIVKTQNHNYLTIIPNINYNRIKYKVEKYFNFLRFVFFCISCNLYLLFKCLIKYIRNLFSRFTN